ncbi:glycosyltransferase [Streptococcus lutetiensis]|uniref:glycosyltransferase family 2 protein n=1 Tax=Streptococcus lutetiensis TaxID=150055 RepID=UPI000F71C862|nr:glycosyltransferase [Streptococcus lutetiensis]VEB81074.1 glycosyltransferase [Streptococcus lutetiensis]
MVETSEPLVTAVITTYKRKPEVVKRALNSIIEQTYNNIEIFVINDCPADKKLVKELRKMIVESSRNRRVKYIVVENNGGACKARNIAIERASGKYFACLDDDDEWLPEKIELQVQALEKQKGAAIAYCNAILRYVDQGKDVTRFVEKQKEGDIYFEQIEKNNIGSCSFPMFRTDVLKEVGGFDINMPALQDWELYLRVLKKYKAVYVHKPVAIYYFYDGERISANSQNRVVAFENIHQKIIKDLENNTKSASSFYMMGTYFYSLNDDMKKAKEYYILGVKSNPYKLKRNIKVFLKMIGRRFIKTKHV